jgi:hypothetical protein
LYFSQALLKVVVYAQRLGRSARLLLIFLGPFAIQLTQHLVDGLVLMADIAGLLKGSRGSGRRDPNLKRQALDFDNLAQEQTHRIADAQATSLKHRSCTLFQVHVDPASHVGSFK